MARRLLSIALFGVLILAAATGFAGPTAAEREQARLQFNAALDLRAAGDHASALAKFYEAERLAVTPRTRLELGRELMLLGRFVEAYAMLTTVASIGVAPSEVAKYAANVAEAELLAATSLERCANIRISLNREPVVATLRIDETVVPREAWRQPRLVDPGAHRIEWAVGGLSLETRRIELVEGQSAEIAFFVSKPPEAVTPPPVPSAALGGGPTVVRDPAVADHRTAIGLTVVGAAGLALGGTFLMHAGTACSRCSFQGEAAIGITTGVGGIVASLAALAFWAVSSPTKGASVAITTDRVLLGGRF